MNALPKPDIIFTHESDLDGLVAGVLLKRLASHLFGVEIPLAAYNYTAWKQRNMTERAAWVTDFSFEPRLDRANWVVIDHHTTETAPQVATLIHDLKKSAGLLAYELCAHHGLASSALGRLVRLSNVADLFLEDDPDFIEALDYASLVKNYQFWNLHTLVGGEIERLLGHPLLEVMAVKRRVENPLGLEWSRANMVNIAPNVGYVDTVVGNSNLIVHHLLEQRTTPYPVLVTLLRKANNTVIASFRSRNGEALKIAAQLQGGGHANAAAATLPRSVRCESEAVDYLRKTLAPPSRRESNINNLASLFAELEAGAKS
jgi:oligoribonuclease NrnB/cAMP/cGMP phosphodiesterase (DHH superfamily)